MARIFYSMSGEGRGHATRVRTIVDALGDLHEFTLFAPGDAYDLLEPAYRGTPVRVHRIPGLRFFYTPAGRLDLLRTAGGLFKYLRHYRRLSRKLRWYIQKRQPDAIFTDFEPALPRAARSCGVPFVSINHQHFLIVNDLSRLPWKLRLHAWLMSLVVRSYYRGEALTIVSSFYFPPVRRGFRNVVPVGVFLRPSVLEAAKSHGGHLVAYLRKFAVPNVLEALEECGMPVRVYGLGEKPRRGNVEFLEVSEEGFVRDLAACEALISTAGNQLVGEALFLEKPVLAMPEPNNREQYINAFYLEEEGTGEWVELESLDAIRLKAFLSRLDHYRSRIHSSKFNGNRPALQALDQFLARL